MNTANLIHILTETIQSVCRAQQGLVLHEPRFVGNEWSYVKDCLDSGWVSSAGSYVDQFERKLEAFTGAKHAIAAVNGTAALHICLLLAGVERHDEVLIPALTFVATGNAVSYCGATPHFVDSSLPTLGIDPAKLGGYLQSIAVMREDGCYNRQTGRRIRAVVPMHTFGHAVDLDPLMEICRNYRITLIEDAAESLGSFYKGKHTGTFGALATLSFNGNKIITTGGGGAILTNDDGLARKAKHLTTTAKLPHAWAFHHDETGYNYRLPNLNAALGCAQMEQLPTFIHSKRKLAQAYQEAFRSVKEVDFLHEPEHAKSNYWLNALILKESYAYLREEILAYTNHAGIMTRPVWTLLSKLPMYRDCPSMNLSQSEQLEQTIINIPSSAKLGEPYVSPV